MCTRVALYVPRVAEEAPYKFTNTGPYFLQPVVRVWCPDRSNVLLCLDRGCHARGCLVAVSK